MSGPTGRESDKFMLRLPDGMRDRIKAAADGNNRSMNAEIVATLEDKYPNSSDSDISIHLAEVMKDFESLTPKARSAKIAHALKAISEIVPPVSTAEYQQAVEILNLLTKVADNIDEDKRDIAALEVEIANNERVIAKNERLIETS